MKIVKKELFKGSLSGIVTLDSKTGTFTGYAFTINLNEEIEGIPKDFVVFFYSIQKPFNILKEPLFLRKGDVVKIGGKIFQNFVGTEQREKIYMTAQYVYNSTLKNGRGLKIKKKEVFKGKLSGTATSDISLQTIRPYLVFSI